MTNGQEQIDGTNSKYWYSDLTTSQLREACWSWNNADGDGVLNGIDGDPPDNTITYAPGDPCDYKDQTTTIDFYGANCTYVGVVVDNQDTNGNGVTAMTELSNRSDQTNPCTPNQPAGYTCYDPTNILRQNGNCDGDVNFAFDDGVLDFVLATTLPRSQTTGYLN